VTYKLTLPCTKLEAEQLEGDLPELGELDPAPVLMTSEPDPARPDEWRLEAYFEHAPDPAAVTLIRALVPSAAGTEPLVERLEEQDWVTLSQAGLEPIRAGRFFVHTPAHRDRVPPDAVPLEIDAGRAFGTGQHETTTGCLMALDALRTKGIHFTNLLDLGTGTGLLAFAAMRLWPEARAAASDIDPVSIEVTEENAAINAVPVGTEPGRLELVVAPGMDHARLQARAPYDLLIANILAGPLIEMALPIAAAVAPGGRLILAGLLDHQADAVASAYRRCGMALATRIDRGDWPTLVMRKRKSTGWR
jgi:ribosomal protein L11 methyltransferase